MLIEQSYIDRVVRATDILAVIAEHVPLLRSGKEWVGRCPFHHDKTPSFYVNQEKQVFICRGCGVAGSAVRFVMKAHMLGFRDAITQLAERSGLLPLMYEGDGAAEPDERSTRLPLYTALEQAASLFQDRLASHSAARAYCDARDLNEDTIRYFRLGYAPAAWSTVGTALKSLGSDVLADAGLVITHEDRRYHDRFRNRLMFPVRDHQGRVIGFGGRQLVDGTGPKYLNSPNTPLFQKGSNLFGLWEAMHPRLSAEIDPWLVVVEGYTDVLALHQHGLSRVVATLGTALTAEQAELLFMRCSDLVLCFDGDRAGAAAARRCLETLLPLMHEGRSLRFVLLPDGTDPDVYVRANGIAAFRGLLDGAHPLSTFLFDDYLPDMRLSTTEERVRAASAFHALVMRVPEGNYRQALLDEIETRTGISLAVKPVKGAGAPPIVLTLIHTLTSLLLAHPEFESEVSPSLCDGSSNLLGMQLFAAMLTYIRATPGATTGQILERFFDSPFSVDLFLAGQVHRPAEETDIMRAEFVSGLERLVGQAQEHSLRDIEAKIHAGNGFDALTAEELSTFLSLIDARKQRERAELYASRQKKTAQPKG